MNRDGSRRSKRFDFQRSSEGSVCITDHRYDRDANALYLAFAGPDPTRAITSAEITPDIIVDAGADRRIVGLEILDPGHNAKAAEIWLHSQGLLVHIPSAWWQ